MSADGQREQRPTLDLDALERSHESTRLGWLDASQKYGFIQATLDALPDLIAAARERDTLSGKVVRLLALHRPVPGDEHAELRYGGHTLDELADLAAGTGNWPDHLRTPVRKLAAQKAFPDLIAAARERDQLRADVEVLRDEARAATNRAVYFARALRQHHDTHQHPDGNGCQPEKWATCRAVEWLREMGQG